MRRARPVIVGPNRIAFLTMTTPWPRTLGILGGLGPHAHVTFENRLLVEAGALGATADQDYPPWILVSAPDTPDRTRAILEQGPSPVASLERALERLAKAGADFAVIPCVTAHAFLARLASPLPILDLLDATLDEILVHHDETARVGLLATDGTLASSLFQKAAARRAPRLVLRTPLDLPGGREIQEEWVMRPIYGPRENDGTRRGGIKAGLANDPQSGLSHREMLLKAVERLREDGARAVICGCTEIPVALGVEAGMDPPLVDPLRVGARAALEIAAGRRPLPGRKGPSPLRQA